MADAAKQKTTHGDVDHGLGDVQALLVVAHEASPADEPSEGALDDPAARQHSKRMQLGAFDDLDRAAPQFLGICLVANPARQCRHLRDLFSVIRLRSFFA